MVATTLMIVGAVLCGISVPMMASAASTVPIPLTADVNAGLTTLGTTFSQILDWLIEIMQDVIFSNPVLLIGLGIFVAGAIIALIYRMIRGG